jgi:hypothetical protein
MSKIITTLKLAYAKFAAHLTKWLGVIGATIMAMGAWVDPATVQMAAQQYLGPYAYRKVGVFLFVLVIFRGWYTGWKARQVPPS